MMLNFNKMILKPKPKYFIFDVVNVSYIANASFHKRQMKLLEVIRNAVKYVTIPIIELCLSTRQVKNLMGDDSLYDLVKKHFPGNEIIVNLVDEETSVGIIGDKKTDFDDMLVLCRAKYHSRLGNNYYIISEDNFENEMNGDRLFILKYTRSDGGKCADIFTEGPHILEYIKKLK